MYLLDDSPAIGQDWSAHLSSSSFGTSAGQERLCRVDAMGTLLVQSRLGMWLAIKEHRLAFEGNERKSFLQLLAAGC